MLFRACSYAAYTSLLFDHKNIPKSLGHHPKWRILGLKKSGCLEVLICLYESISLCAAGFDATLSRKKSTSNTSSSFVSFLSTTSCQMGSHQKYHEISWNASSLSQSHPFFNFSSKRPFDLASTPAPASRSICITLVLPFDEACHSGVRPRRNK